MASIAGDPASTWDMADQASSVLGPESELVASLDVAHFGRALASAFWGASLHPAASAAATMEFAADLASIGPTALARWVGVDVSTRVPLDAKDRRFADPAWSDNPVYISMRLAYAAGSRLCGQLVGAAELDRRTEAKARTAIGFLLDALAPTNFALTNPAVLKRAFDTGGLSLLRGARNFLDDLAHNNGRPRQVDSSAFRIGENLAATPGKVVYRNDLMELLQYEPQTAQVHAVPLLCSPPWINKYYIMDLAPGRSFVEWAVQHNRTVFAISYRNPGPEMSGVTLDDYLVYGPRQALDVVAEITGAQRVDIVGLCLGGALTAITAAYLTAIGDARVGNLTLLNTLLDYSEPGALGVFTDEAAVARLEKQMARRGHLPGTSMAGTFDMLRANDLIFNYLVANWLMGQQPPAFDILAWNSDSTRMPALMHSFYLRNFYVENKLARGELEIAGRTIQLGDIKQDTYIVSAENDHIVPWTSAYASAGLISGPARFILSSGGHIAGIVNPPGPKGWYLVADSTPPAATEWRAAAERHSGSWWEDWAAWSTEHAGELVHPPPLGSEVYPARYDAPGGYIRT
jgi:polyhydroxyalkanoate synthase subunit PhaC